MVIASLINYYEALRSEGKVPIPGYSVQKIHFVLKLDKKGSLKEISPLFDKVISPKGKELIFPKKITLPFSGSRSSGVKPYFAWEKASYLLGLDEAENQSRSLKCFKAFRELQHDVLDDKKDIPAVDAYLHFLDEWDPLKDNYDPMITKIKEDLMQGNIVVSVDDEYLHENKSVTDSWNTYFQRTESEGLPTGRSIISGKLGPIAKTHPMIGGFPGANSSGATLISFNLPAASSEFKEQGENAPMTPYEAFAYTTAIKYMLQNKGVFTIGPESVFVWSDKDPDEQQTAIRALVETVIYGEKEDNEDNIDPRELIEQLADGESVKYKGCTIDPDSEYSLLIIAPAQARLSIKMFAQKSVQSIMESIVRFREDINIFPIGRDVNNFSLYYIIGATKRIGDKSDISPELLEDMIKTIFTGSPFSATMYEAFNRRFKSIRDIRPVHASFIKGYYRRKNIKDYPKEVLQVALDKDCNDQAYILGRLFFLMERLQIEAINNIQSTIRDKYIYSASNTPAMVFPILINKSQYHIRKLKKIDEKRGFAMMYERQIDELLDRLTSTYPTRLSIEQQSRFQLGYYHQKAFFFTPKEKKEAMKDSINEE